MLMVGTIIGWYKADNEDKVTDFVVNVERGFLYVRTENFCGKSLCTVNLFEWSAMINQNFANISLLGWDRTIYNSREVKCGFVKVKYNVEMCI